MPVSLSPAAASKSKSTTIFIVYNGLDQRGGLSHYDPAASFDQTVVKSWQDSTEGRFNKVSHDGVEGEFSSLDR